MKKVAILAVAAAVVLAAGLAAQAATVTVYPGNMNGWFFSKSAEAGVAEMVTGPGTPPLGSGSAHMNPGYGTDYAGIVTNNHAGARLADLTAFSFSTYCTQNDGLQLPYMMMPVDTNDDGGFEDVLYFEPAYQNPGQPAGQMNAWQTWNALTGSWTDSPGTGTNMKSLATYLESNPDARLASPGGDFGAINLLMGMGNDEDRFNGYVDNMTIGTAAGTTTYNFEVTPEPATMALLAAGGIAALLRRRVKK